MMTTDMKKPSPTTIEGLVKQNFTIIAPGSSFYRRTLEDVFNSSMLVRIPVKSGYPNIYFQSRLNIKITLILNLF